MNHKLWNIVALTVTLVAGVCAGRPVHAVGYWNLPGNFCQCAGYGWGAGHHSCLVLGPMSCNGCCAHNEVRLPCAPQPPYGSYGCSNFNFDFRQPAQLAPVEYAPSVPSEESLSMPVETSPVAETPTLAADPLPMPEGAAPPRAIFDAPAER